MVITIIGMLMALLLPAVQAVRESARTLQCQNNLRQYAIGFQHYHSVYNFFPQGNVGDLNNYQLNTWWTARSMLLPYMEGGNVYQLINYNYPGDCFEMGNSAVADPRPGSYILPHDKCPDNPNAGTIWFGFPGFGHHGCTNYLGVMGTTQTANDGILFHSLRCISLRDVKDG